MVGLSGNAFDPISWIEEVYGEAEKYTMKKLTCTFIVLLLLCLCTVAYAADPLTLDITALDYQTGKAVSKTYVPNELFRLKVDIGIPRFYDLTDMELIIELDGVKLDENNLQLADGTYNIWQNEPHS